MNFKAFAIVGTLALALAGCGGSGSISPSGAPPIAAPGPGATAQTVPTSFTFTYSGNSTASATRSPRYLTANVKSVTIAFTAFNGGAIPTGLTNASVTSNLTLTGCPCTTSVSGPSVPPGSDTFSLTTYDATGGVGNVISKATPTFTIHAGQANSNSITLDGLPNAFAFGPLPSGAAGSVTAPTVFSLTVKDADGNTILGTYANPVTITDSDTSSLTLGSALAVNGGSATSSITSTASGDSITLGYGGLAILPATLTASASGATSDTATFTPVLNPIVYSGPTNSGTNEMDFYATSGTGSTYNFTASEIGWTNTPYNKTLTLALPAGCSNIVDGSTSTLTGTTFTENIAAAPAVGTCVASLADGVGQTLTGGITFTYTTVGFGAQ